MSHGPAILYILLAIIGLLLIADFGGGSCDS